MVDVVSNKRIVWGAAAVALARWLIVVMASALSTATYAQTPSSTTPGYFNFDIHPTSAGGNQIIFGSAYVVNGPIPSPFYDIAINKAAYDASPSSFSGYMVLGSFTSDVQTATGGTVNPGADGTLTYKTTGTNAVTNIGLGCGSTAGPCDASTRNLATQTYAMKLGFDSGTGKGWYISNAAFGFTVNNGTTSYDLFVEGGATSSNLDVHSAVRQSNGYYNSQTATTTTTMVNNPAVECMASTPTATYCLSLAGAQVNPEINGAVLPKVALLLGCLFLISRRVKIGAGAS
jgi:hypothetical protein